MAIEFIYLDKFRVQSFDQEKDIVYFHLRNLDDSEITDEDQTYFMELLNDFGKWELMIKLEKAKSSDTNSDDYSKIVANNQLFEISCQYNPQAKTRGGRVYLFWITPINYIVERDIVIKNLRKFVIDGFINLNKWLLLKKINN